MTADPCAVDPADHLALVGWCLEGFLRVHPAAWRAEDDLRSAGYEELCRAARAYDPERAAFSTYATRRLRRRLRREWFKLAGAVRRSYRDGGQGDVLCVSLEATVPGCEEFTLEDTLPAEGPSTEDLASMAVEAGEVLERLHRELDAREVRVIVRRRIAAEPATLKTIGLEFGLTRERIRQIERDALEKLRADHR